MKAFAGLFVLGSILVTGGGAMAQQTCPASPAPCDIDVKPVTLNPAPAPAAPAVAAPAVAGRQQLPVTGADAGILALAGTVLVGGGAVLVWRTKGTASA